MRSKKEDIKFYINNHIVTKLYREGQMIESENELAKNLSVSRTTVRIALQEMVNDGVLYRVKGRGTFVSVRPKYTDFKWGCGFTREANRLGLMPCTKRAKIRKVKASKEIASILRITQGEKVWEVSRVRYLNDSPFLYSKEYYIYNQCEDLNMEIINNSIYSFLEMKGVKLGFTDQSMSAVLATKEIADKMGIKVCSPLICVEGVSYMKNGCPFNAGTMYYRTDVYKINQSVEIR